MRPKKRYGQHFLRRHGRTSWLRQSTRNPTILSRDRPRPGALTLRLAPRVASVTAIELDPEMVALLAPKAPPNVTLVQADFLEFDLDSLRSAGRFRVAGNLPYNVSSPILFALIAAASSSGRPSSMRRSCCSGKSRTGSTRGPGPAITACSPSSCSCMPTCGRCCRCRRAPSVRAPKVHSTVVLLRFRPPAVAVPDEPAFEAMVRTMFMQRRKTLLNALRPYAVGRARDVRGALTSAGIDPSRRPETLQLTELARLAEFFATASR